MPGEPPCQELAEIAKSNNADFQAVLIGNLAALVTSSRTGRSLAWDNPLVVPSSGLQLK